jgi:chromatin remodeling complex protein RSC6
MANEFVTYVELFEKRIKDNISSRYNELIRDLNEKFEKVIQAASINAEILNQAVIFEVAGIKREAKNFEAKIREKQQQPSLLTDSSDHNLKIKIENEECGGPKRHNFLHEEQLELSTKADDQATKHTDKEIQTAKLQKCSEGDSLKQSSSILNCESIKLLTSTDKICKSTLTISPHVSEKPKPNNPMVTFPSMNIDNLVLDNIKLETDNVKDCLESTELTSNSIKTLQKPPEILAEAKDTTEFTSSTDGSPSKDVCHDLETENWNEQNLPSEKYHTSSGMQLNAMESLYNLGRNESISDTLEGSTKDNSERSVPNSGPSPGKQISKKRKLKDGEGLLKRYKVSPEMAEIIGRHPEGITRHDCLRQLRKYIKENNLQDEKHKQFFLPDDKMGKIFGLDRLQSISMTKYIQPHFLPLDVSDAKFLEDPHTSQMIFSHMENISLHRTDDNANEIFNLIEKSNHFHPSNAMKTQKSVQIMSGDELKQADLLGGQENLSQASSENTIIRGGITLNLENMDCNKPEKDNKEPKLDSTKVSPNSVKLFLKCQKCNYDTAYKGNLKMHMNHVHGNIKRTTYACDRCEYTACRKGRLYKHYASHHANLCCMYCKYVATDEDVLLSHIRSKHRNLAALSSMNYRVGTNTLTDNKRNNSKPSKSVVTNQSSNQVISKGDIFKTKIKNGLAQFDEIDHELGFLGYKITEIGQKTSSLNKLATKKKVNSSFYNIAKAIASGSETSKFKVALNIGKQAALNLQKHSKLRVQTDEHVFTELGKFWKKRFSCKSCYNESRKTLDRIAALSARRKVRTYCSGCNNCPTMCKECFDRIHKS